MDSKKAWWLDATRLLGHFLERATEPTHPMYGGIKPTHALSHSGEDRNAPPSKRRTAGKWDT